MPGARVKRCVCTYPGCQKAVNRGGHKLSRFQDDRAHLQKVVDKLIPRPGNDEYRNQVLERPDLFKVHTSHFSEVDKVKAPGGGMSLKKEALPRPISVVLREPNENRQAQAVFKPGGSHHDSYQERSTTGADTATTTSGKSAAGDGRLTPDKGGLPLLFEAMQHEELLREHEELLGEQEKACQKHEALLREQEKAQQQLAQAGKDLLERAKLLQSIAHVAADAMGEAVWEDKDLSRKPASLGGLCPLACRALLLVEQLAERLRNAEGALRAAQSRQELLEDKMRSSAALTGPPQPPQPPVAAPSETQQPLLGQPEHMLPSDANTEPFMDTQQPLLPPAATPGTHQQPLLEPSEPIVLTDAATEIQQPLLPPVAALLETQQPLVVPTEAATEPYTEIEPSTEMTFTLTELLQDDTCDSGGPVVGEFSALLGNEGDDRVGDPADEATTAAASADPPPPTGPLGASSPTSEAPPPLPTSEVPPPRTSEAPPVTAVTSEATVTAASATALLEAAWSGPHQEQKGAATAAASDIGSCGAAKPSKKTSKTKASAAVISADDLCDSNKRQKTSCECGRAEPHYGLPKGPNGGGGNEADARWCSRCRGKPPGAVNVHLRPCECGASVAGFGVPGTLPKDLRWCHKCPGKPPGAVYLGGLSRGGKRKLCGCGSAQPTFGLPGEDKKLARWCSRCPDKPLEAVNLMSARCECGKTYSRSYALPGDKGRWCSKCPSRPPEAVLIRNKSCECGLKLPSLGLPGQARQDARWCRKCPDKPSNAVDVVSKRCECGLTVSPCFAPPGGTWKDTRWCKNCPGKPPDAKSLSNEQYAARVARQKKAEVARELARDRATRGGLLCSSRLGKSIP